jgi:hypothetical protein
MQTTKAHATLIIFSVVNVSSSEKLHIFSENNFACQRTTQRSIPEDTTFQNPYKVYVSLPPNNLKSPLP